MKDRLKCIMLVDDDDDDNFFHTRIIKKIDCADIVMAKQTAVEALEYFKLEKDNSERCQTPDLIFLDINMPQMDGFQFLDRLSMDAEVGRTPVVMVSAYGDTDNILKSQRYSRVRDFVIKPFQAIDLIELVRRHA